MKAGAGTSLTVLGSYASIFFNKLIEGRKMQTLSEGYLIAKKFKIEKPLTYKNLVR
jgi:hypothetical protein